MHQTTSRSSAVGGCEVVYCCKLNPQGSLSAGASFFYQKGPVPYEAQEVRAFGLFLTDMVKLIPRRRRGP